VLDEEWYTVDQIATSLKVHEQTVRRWLRDGDLDGRNFGGKTGWRVPAHSLKAFLDKRPEGNVAA
jgi:excisionase family DNA binding protein